MSSVKRVRCAVYTRKSTEEGLEQDFNSLHAQREACEAYIASQRSEGWVVLPKVYDDGGYSGGNIDRPALTELLADIERGEVDTVVVYKIDRLTRSLTDFGRIVERFDQKGASFVSVTQSFNTTTSMGRLTLNVLLSFAQFEREVTSERIRDKIAASKRRGMWMGGSPPTGYDPVNRKLIVNPEEAEFVRSVFERFLKVKNIKTLADELAAQGRRSKSWESRRGHQRGGFLFVRGAIDHMLRNRLYLGEIRHKKEVYPGQHEAIVDQELFDKVQLILAKNSVHRVDRPATRIQFPFKGIVFDDKGHKMSPVRQRQENGTHRRYHVSQALIQGRKADAGSISRVPANGLEELIADRLRQILDNHVQPLVRNKPHLAVEEGPVIATSLAELVARIVILARNVEITVPLAKLVPLLFASWDGDPSDVGASVVAELQSRLPASDVIVLLEEQVQIRLPVRLKFRGGERTLIESGSSTRRSKTKLDPRLVKGLLRAHRWRELLESGEVQTNEQIARREGITRAYVRAILPLAFLAPDLTQDILNGTFHPGLTIDRMVRLKFPLDWEAQRRFVAQISE